MPVSCVSLSTVPALKVRGAPSAVVMIRGPRTSLEERQAAATADTEDGNRRGSGDEGTGRTWIR